jgi:hypothetical protein
MSYASEQGILNAQWNAAQLACMAEEQRMRPFVLLRPRMFPDGDLWCALYGRNMQEGVAGFGITPEQAAEAFDKAWREEVPTQEQKP